jgi:leucyl aminopeptidase (aminopeptidase T)/transposase-like protein
MSARDPRPEDGSLRDYLVLSDTRQIRAIAREDRLQMLNLLIGEAMTVSAIARSLQVPPNRAHYHVQQLLRHGLIRQVGTGRRRRAEERFYRAAARNLIMDPQVACAEGETAAALMRSAEAVFLDWRRREILDIDFGEVASLVVRDCLRVAPGENVLVMFGPQGYELAEAVMVEVTAAGAVPQPKPWSRNFLLRTLDRNSADELASLPFLHPDLERKVDAVAFISSNMPQGKEPSPEQREKLPLFLGTVSRWQRSLKERNIRYLEFDLPHRAELDAGDMDPEEAAEVYWRCVRTDYAALRRRADALLSRLSAHPRLTLNDADGSRLEVEVDATLHHKSDGIISEDDLAGGRCLEVLPAGSLAVVPVPGSADGTFVADYVFIRGEHIWNTEVEIREGRIVKVQSESGADLVTQSIAQAAGQPDCLASISFGINPAGRGPTGMPVLDGCLEGTVTLAFGNNEMLGGTVRATLDLNLPSTSVSVSAGDVRLVEEGRLV